MPTVYAVRCNFQSPELEAEWNEWYNGPKMADMLALPQFLNAQRYRATGLDSDVKYLALWLLESPGALQTEEYTSGWGFARWAPMIGDWSRDLIEPSDQEQAPPFPVPAEGAAVHVAWFDDRTGLDELRRSAGAEGDWYWGTCVGLDVSCSFVAIRSYDAAPDAPAAKAFDGLAVLETVYHPICPPGRS